MSPARELRFLLTTASLEAFIYLLSQIVFLTCVGLAQRSHIFSIITSFPVFLHLGRQANKLLVQVKCPQSGVWDSLWFEAHEWSAAVISGVDDAGEKYNIVEK